jgi:flavorubredoxin
MKVCNKLKELMEADYKSVKVIDLLRCDMSEAVARAFKYKKLVLASITYNGDMFPLMKKFIDALCDRNYQNRSVGFIQNGSWAPNSARLMQDKLKDLKDINILPTVTVKSTIYSDTELKALAEALKD